MKTAEETLTEFSKNYGMIKDNPRAIVKASEAIAAMEAYAAQRVAEATKDCYPKEYCEWLSSLTINAWASVDKSFDYWTKNIKQ